MAGEQGTEGAGITDPTQSVIEKGKGKAVDTPQDVSMGEDSDSSDEETGAEEDVRLAPTCETSNRSMSLIEAAGT